MYDDFSEDYDRFVNWSGRLAYEMPFLEATLAQEAPCWTAPAGRACTPSPWRKRAMRRRAPT